MTNGKSVKEWQTPTLATLDVSRTLSGTVLNVAESQPAGTTFGGDDLTGSGSFH